MDGQTALWVGVLATGVYHGLNPGMGWPLAVAAGLMEKRGVALARTLALLAFGHCVSITVVLFPFAMLSLLLDWAREIQIGAGLSLIAFAVILLVMPRHPRWIARIGSRQVALWSLTVGLLHGAGLMLVPMLLGLCAAPGTAEQGFMATRGGFIATAGVMLAVAATHTIALIAAGGGLAWIVFRVLGLKALRRSWFDLSRIWACSLATAGAFSVWSAF